MTLDGKILRGLFEHERLKPATTTTNHGNINSLVQLKQVLTLGMVILEKKVYYLKQPVGYETNGDLLLPKEMKNTFLNNIHFTHFSKYFTE